MTKNSTMNLYKKIKLFLRRYLSKDGPSEGRVSIKALEQIEKTLTRIPIYGLDRHLGDHYDSKGLVSISDTEYTEVVEGIFCRIIKHPTDILFKEERTFEKEIRKLWKNDFIMIFVLFEEKGFFPRHHHEAIEIMTSLKGSFEDRGDCEDPENPCEGEVVKRFSPTGVRTQTILPYTPHTFHGVEKGKAISQIKISGGVNHTPSHHQH